MKREDGASHLQRRAEQARQSGGQDFVLQNTAREKKFASGSEASTK